MNPTKKSGSGYPTLEESRKILRESAPDDFDGHTSFKELTIEERIQWASLSAMAVWNAKKEDQKNT